MKALFILVGGILSSCAIEKPKYETLRKEGDFEVRKYAAIKVVSTPMEDMDKRNASFRKLFKYISGENEGKQKIAMTSPVFMDMGAEKKPEGEAGRMSFMIPAKVTEQGAPKPDGEDLELSEIEGGTFAVLRFKGWDKEPNRKAATLALGKIVTKMKLKPIGTHFFSFYDPPWTPELLRRNEIWQRVEL